MARSRTVKDYDLSHYLAENMTIRWLTEQVCSKNADFCRACECLDACAFGRRYIRAVDAGEIQQKPKLPGRGNRAADEARRSMERKVQFILAGMLTGRSLQALYKEAGYASYKSAQRALNKYTRRCREAVAQ